MSNIKDTCCKPRLHYFVLARWPFATSSSSLGARAAIHAASQVDHEKRVASVSNSMHARGSVPIVMVLRPWWAIAMVPIAMVLGPSGRRSSAKSHVVV